MKDNQADKDLENAKIIINSAAESTFFQCMRSGKPTLLVLHKDLWNFTPEVKEMYYILKNKKIIFTDINLAIDHVEKIWKEPLAWWNSKDIIEARDLFEKTCSLSDDNNWKLFFKNINKHLS